jgi:hypothetical protein
MALMAYEKAHDGDYSLVHELLALLEHPYEEQSAETEEKWFHKTPIWARDLPGTAFLS